MLSDNSTDNQHNTKLLPDSLEHWPPLNELIASGEVFRLATSPGNCDTYILHTQNGSKYFLKTFVRQPFLLKIFFGKASIRNEYKILKYLSEQNFSAAPEVYKLIDNNSIVMEFFADSERLLQKARYNKKTIPSKEFFHNFATLIKEMHDLGVCHGDIRRANILRSPDDKVLLIDWATAVISRKKGGSILSGMIFNIVRRSDLFSLASITHTYYSNILDDELQYALEHPPWYLRLGRFLRRRLYRHFLKKIVKRKKQPKEKKKS